MVADLASMTVQQLKLELMEFNDSSFVFNDRDELICALKSARRVDLSRRKAFGEETDTASASADAPPPPLAGGGSGGNRRSSDEASVSTSGSGGQPFWAAVAAANDNSAAKDNNNKDATTPEKKKGHHFPHVPGRRRASISILKDTTKGDPNRKKKSSGRRASFSSSPPVDMGGGGGRNRQNSGSLSPTGGRRTMSPSLSSLDEDGTAASHSTHTTRGTSLSSATTAAVPQSDDAAAPADAFDEGPGPGGPEAESVSRRLVEYFAMVSCVPVEPLEGEGSAAADKNKKQRRGLGMVSPARPPDPSRDKLNSRTMGRFEVRRAHLASVIHSSPDNSDDSTCGSSEEEEEDGEKGGDGDDAGGGKVEDAREDARNTLLEPKITARYPSTDHADQPLNLRLPQFCHPEGTDFLRPTTVYKMPRVHHFVLTDSAGGKQYGTALTVLEEFHNKQRRGEEDEGKTPDGGGGASKNGKKEKTYYAPRVLVLLSTWPYLTAFRTYLTQLYRLATTTDVMTAPIERYIQNICSEVPAPPPGAFEVRLTLLGSDIRFWAPPADQPVPYVSLPYRVLFECLDIGNVLFAWYTLACEQKVLLVSSQLSLLTVCAEILTSLLFPMRWSHLYIPVLPRSLGPMLDAPMPYLCGISRENFPYAVEDISDETVVVDLDRNVVTLGPNTPDLPPLPHSRRKKLESALKANAGEVFWEARNLTKSDVLRARSSGDQKNLAAMLDDAGAVWEERIGTRDDAFNLAHAPDSASLQHDEDANNYLDDGSLPKQSRWDAVQEAFLRFYVSLLQDYRNFLPEGADTKEKSTWRGGSRLRFQTEGFVSAAPAEHRPFLEELAATQQFDDFVTRRMHNAADAPDIRFFDQSIDAKGNRSRLRVKKKGTPFLHSASAHRDLKRVRAVEPNAEGLPTRETKAYTYEVWPLTFDEDLFGTPRPIPSIISAEFDRRTALRSMLRSKYGIVDESRGTGGRNRSPEVTAFILFFATFTSVIGKELANVARRRSVAAPQQQSIQETIGLGAPPLVASSPGGTSRGLSDLDDDAEAAVILARAQVDLGYHTLALMRLRKLPPEPIVYKLLIQACGRTGITHRASALMDMLARDGLATNSEIYTSLITAFSNDESRAPSSLALYRERGGEDTVSNLSFASSSQQLLLERRESSSVHSLELSESGVSQETGATGATSGGGTKRRDRMKRAVSSRFASNKKGLKNSLTGKTKKMGASKLSSKSRHSNLAMTMAVAKQIDLGEKLLESLHPGLEVDVEAVCPKCAVVLSESDVCKGWTPCASNEYRTTCPSCRHGFVPKFSVSCQSPTFEGSQGRGTPLYCDHLSPWVLFREIRSVIAATGGVESILDVKFREGSDVSATLWWNMIITFRRYKLPFIFLLQGSFRNQLILPSSSLGESNHTDVSQT